MQRGPERNLERRAAGCRAPVVAHEQTRNGALPHTFGSALRLRQRSGHKDGGQRRRVAVAVVHAGHREERSCRKIPSICQSILFDLTQE